MNTVERMLMVTRSVLLLGGISLPLVLVPYVHHLLPPETVVAIDEARFYGDLPATNGTIQTLPDDWRLNHPGGRQGWYRTSVILSAAPQERWALYLPAVDMNVAVYLNGERIGDGGPFTAPMARNWHRPLLFPVRAGLLRSGPNVIEAHLRTGPARSGLLGKLYLGRESTLRPLYQQRLLLKVGIVWAITVGLGFQGLFIGALWLLRRQETIYGWFALVVTVWALHNLNILVVHIPVSTRVWDWVTRYGCLQWFAILGVIFINRYINEPQPGIEKRLCIAGVFAMLSFAALPEPIFYALARHVWSPVMLSVGLYAMFRLWYAYRKERTPEVLGLLIAALVVVIIGLRDALMVNDLWDRQHGLYLQYAAPVVLGVFAWILLRRYVTALNLSETLNTTLELRLEKERRKLEGNYRKLQALERERVLAEERERIMRDMHDGVGGHLVSTLALIGRGRTNLREVSESLHSALADLRLMIDSLDTSTSDLSTLLGMLRERLQRRLEASGIRVHWQVESLPAVQAFGPRKALQVMRIVQEAITNVLKHAQAKTLTLRAVAESAPAGCHISIEISDDGCGIENISLSGNGLPNMRHRAQAIGAALAFESTAAGTCVRLTLPVCPAA